MKRFRIKKTDTLKMHLYSSSGKLLTSIYDSGYTRLSQCYDALMRKCCNPPRNTTYSVYNEENDTYWSS